MSSCTVNSFKDYIKHGVEDKITNYTIDNKCSNCGNCCNNILPVNKDEIKRIKRYIKEHDIKAVKRFYPTDHKSIDMMCPFRDDDKKICNIYEVRPKVCRLFLCNNEAEAKKNREKLGNSRHHIDFRQEFYNDSIF